MNSERFRAAAPVAAFVALFSLCCLLVWTGRVRFEEHCSSVMSIGSCASVVLDETVANSPID